MFLDGVRAPSEISMESYPSRYCEAKSSEFYYIKIGVSRDEFRASPTSLFQDGEPAVTF